MDRGMTHAENVAWLQHTGRRYLIGMPKSALRQWAGKLAEAADWQTVRTGVEAKLRAGPAGRRDLRAVPLGGPGGVRRLGSPQRGVLRPAHQHHRLGRRDAVADPCAAHAEAAFRIQKSELSIRPIWHRRTDRVQAHIFVCFLASVLWKTLEKSAGPCGFGEQPSDDPGGTPADSKRRCGAPAGRRSPPRPADPLRWSARIRRDNRVPGFDAGTCAYPHRSPTSTQHER